MTDRHLDRRTVAGLTALTLAALLAGCAPAAPPGAATGTPAQTGPTSPAPGTSAPAAQAAGLQGSAAFQALTPEQQQKVGALEAMDMATFEKQSRDDQLAYGAFLREVYQADAVAASGGSLQSGTKVTSSSAGPEIIGDEALKAATASWSAQSGSAVTPAAQAGNDPKMAPSRVSPLFATAYADAAAPAGAAPGTVVADIADPARMEVVDESNNFLPMDGTREELPFKIVELQSTDTQTPTQFYFAYTPFINVHGADDGTWILMEAAEESQENWIPDLAVID